MPGILDMLSQTWPARLAQDVWGGITAPRDAWQGKLDALSPEGIARAGNLAGFIMGGGTAAPAQRNATGMIRAYHGSPYDFEKFDLSKIGTGEGAQAYGHGLYFAEKEGVARQYRDALSGGRMMEGATIKLDPDVGYIATKPGGEQKVFSFEKEAKEWVEHPGRMYEVNINAKPEQFLDWDKAIHKQTPEVARALEDVYPGMIEQRTQSEKSSTIASAFPYGIRPQISEALNSGGIPGIKYLDQGSRFTKELPQLQSTLDAYKRQIAEAAPVNATDRNALDTLKQRSRDLEEQIANYQAPTSNYVLFRDDIIDILRKYGLVGTSAGLAATSDQLPIPSQPAPIYAQ